MKIKTAFWTASLVLPATIVPLSTATSCSQTWGYKTPISIGSSIKDDITDPFYNFNDDTTLLDLNGDPIVSVLQSNYAIDTAKSVYYGYSLPEKWDSKAEKEGWTGAFVDGSAGWYDSSSSAYEKSGNSTKDKSTKTVVSYRNNMLASNGSFIGQIGANISQYYNYALQYQGTQLGSKYGDEDNLKISWGVKELNHGSPDSIQNKEFTESIFASNAVSGESVSKAIMHPTHVEFTIDDGYFPIVAYQKKDDKLVVSDATLKLLNGAAVRPSNVTTAKYWSSVVESTEKVVSDGKTVTYKYKTYTYNNVPVSITPLAFIKSFVNANKNDSFLVDDFYSSKDDIVKAIGSTWNDKIVNYVTGWDNTPHYATYAFTPDDAAEAIEPAHSEQNIDKRLATPSQNSFIVLLNYAYKECVGIEGTTEKTPAEMDRVSMTDLVSIFPAYYIDKDLGLEETFYTKASNDTDGYIFNTSLITKYNNLYMELMKRSANQGLITKAKDLNDTSKKLLKFLAYQFGEKQADKEFVVDTNEFLDVEDIK